MRPSRLVFALSTVVLVAPAGSFALDASDGAVPAKRGAQPRHLTFVADHHREHENAKGLVFTERLRRGPVVVGSVAGRCSYAGLQEGDAVPCSLQVKLSGGTLYVRGKLVPNAAHQKLSIVGGTGAYAGATGTTASVSLSQSRTKLLFTIE